MKIFRSVILISMICISIPAIARSRMVLNPHISSSKDYIPVKDWQIIVSPCGICVVSNRIYFPSILNYDEKNELFYIHKKCRSVDYRALNDYPELKRKVDYIIMRVSHE